jgi:biotin synthase-related radical SAM superfamily protein
MTYRKGKCTANCAFCPQARESRGKADLLSRVTWPTFPTETVIAAITSATEQHKIRRVCIQALNYPEVFAHLEALVKKINEHSSVPISVSCQPHNTENIERLKVAGADRLGIALDAATETVFNRVKGGCYSWKNEFHLLSKALEIFGRGNVSTHVIVGLGETEQETVEIIRKCVSMGVLTALFAFTPVRGTTLEGDSPPRLESYRRIQFARYLIVSGKTTTEKMRFDVNGKITDFGLSSQDIVPIILSGVPFLTSGCADCNRPYYNEKPGGPLYNYPKKPTEEEIEKIRVAVCGVFLLFLGSFGRWRVTCSTKRQNSSIV